MTEAEATRGSMRLRGLAAFSSRRPRHMARTAPPSIHLLARKRPRHKKFHSCSKATKLYWLAGVVFSAALLALIYPFAMQFFSVMEQSRTADDTTKAVSAWPEGKSATEFTDAQAYNAKLARSPQQVLGEAPDPFSANTNASASDSDATYQSLLNANDGVMGSIVIPKISVNLPIYHGTSDRVLAQGAGHLYGTSLPVGGSSTHSVITGHRGLPDALLFTRLDEIQRGDVFYIKTLGTTLGYKVDKITVLKPQDVIDKLKIVKGEDRVTLMTCTPYGVNTMRLLISGIRVAIPQQAPYPEQSQKDLSLLLALIAVFVTIGVIITTVVMRLSYYPWLGQHHMGRKH